MHSVGSAVFHQPVAGQSLNRRRGALLDEARERPRPCSTTYGPRRSHGIPPRQGFSACGSSRNGGPGSSWPPRASGRRGRGSGLGFQRYDPRYRRPSATLADRRAYRPAPQTCRETGRADRADRPETRAHPAGDGIGFARNWTPERCPASPARLPIHRAGGDRVPTGLRPLPSGQSSGRAREVTLPQILKPGRGGRSVYCETCDEQPTARIPHFVVIPGSISMHHLLDTAVERELFRLIEERAPGTRPDIDATGDLSS